MQDFPLSLFRRPGLSVYSEVHVAVCLTETAFPWLVHSMVRCLIEKEKAPWTPFVWQALVGLLILNKRQKEGHRKVLWD